MKHRQTWNEYFMSIACLVASRSTCPRKSVGCVIVRDKAIIATGYNGSLPKTPHCSDVDGCYIESNHCVRTIHAETNAINQAAKNGVSLKGSVIYCNVEPCWSCCKNIISCGITDIYYKFSYGEKTKLHKKSLAQSSINYIKMNENE